jgi:HEPN domain-containing protein
MDNLDVHLNSFASRCFRDVADRDYISARMCYRAGLISQFHWAALQAFEKYFKAILLYNRIRAKDLRHDLARAREYSEKIPFKIRMSISSLKLLDHLNDYGRFRYLETSYFIYGPKLVELDKAVWELRRYCRVLDYRLPRKGKEPIPMLELELQRNEAAEKRSPQEFQIIGGALETIIKKRSNPARAPLIWQNAFFGNSRRNKVRVPIHFYAENAPLSLVPQVLDHVLDYVYLPKEVVNAFRAVS